MAENIRKRLSTVYEKGFREGRGRGLAAGFVFGCFVTYIFALTVVNVYPETSYLSQELMGPPEDFGYIRWFPTHGYNSAQCFV